MRWVNKTAPPSQYFFPQPHQQALTPSLQPAPGLYMPHVTFPRRAHAKECTQWSECLAEAIIPVIPFFLVALAWSLLIFFYRYLKRLDEQRRQRKVEHKSTSSTAPQHDLYSTLHEVRPFFDTHTARLADSRIMEDAYGVSHPVILVHSPKEGLEEEGLESVEGKKGDRKRYLTLLLKPLKRMAMVVHKLGELWRQKK